MSNTISAEEYRRMMSDKKHGVPETSKAKKAEPKTGKLDTVAAIKAFANYFGIDPKSTNFWITQMRNSNKV